MKPVSDKVILNFCGSPRAIDEVAKKFGFQSGIAAIRLRKLIADGLIQRISPDPLVDRKQRFVTMKESVKSVYDPFYMATVLSNEREKRACK